MKKVMLLALAASTVFPITVIAKDAHPSAHAAVSDKVIAEQHANLASSTEGKGYGPQAPRDIDAISGSNTVVYTAAPPYQKMNLCNIHFHKNAEHKGGEFTTYAGNGDGQGNQTGFKYSGKLTEAELAPVTEEICPSKHGALHPGDTIEIHYVHSTAQVTPGPTLGACLSESIKNPQLRVEAQVYVLVNDANAADFGELTKLGKNGVYHQALGIPKKTGKPVQFSGSTTGPGFNEQGSPFQVTWSVRPKVLKVNVQTVGKWCKSNVFNEDHAHGVRNLVINPKLLAPISRRK